MKKLIIPIILSFLMGCVSQKVKTETTMDSWLGHTKQELIMTWGVPARIASDGGTGEILVYANQVYIPSRANTFYDGYGGSNTTYTQTINYWDYKMFYVNSDGKIYHWMTQRQQIPPTQIDLRIK